MLLYCQYCICTLWPLSLECCYCVLQHYSLSCIKDTCYSQTYLAHLEKVSLYNLLIVGEVFLASEICIAQGVLHRNCGHKSISRIVVETDASNPCFLTWFLASCDVQSNHHYTQTVISCLTGKILNQLSKRLMYFRNNRHDVLCSI